MILNTKTIASAIASGSLLLSFFTTSAFASTIEVTGNGSSSNNDVNVSSTNNTTVTQRNDANISNNVTNTTNTGGNRANDNTGGDVTINTGNSASSVDISNRANVNSADISNCGCVLGTDVTVAGNGSFSRNNANVDNHNTTRLTQDNRANFNNTVNNNGQTGNNTASRNTGGVGTGGGDVTITTGHAASDVAVSNAANANFANIGGTSGSNTSGSGGSSARIIGNGSSSNNRIDLDMSNSVRLAQANDANIRNRINNNLRTGNNRASDNTGGDVTIDTGSALAAVDVDNMANFNSANIDDCGCFSHNLLAKVAGNGSFSRNRIDSDLNNTLSVNQNRNRARLNNDLNSDLKSGQNSANTNTGGVGGLGNDPLILTGDTFQDTMVRNQTNLNEFGQGSMEFPFPLHNGSNTNVSFHFDISGMSHLLHMLGVV